MLYCQIFTKLYSNNLQLEHDLQKKFWYLPLGSEIIKLSIKNFK